MAAHASWVAEMPPRRRRSRPPGQQGAKRYEIVVRFELLDDQRLVRRRVDVDGIRAGSDAVGKGGPLYQILRNQDITPLDQPAFPDAELLADVNHAGLFKSRDSLLEKAGILPDLPAAFDLGVRPRPGGNDGRLHDRVTLTMTSPGATPPKKRTRSR